MINFKSFLAIILAFYIQIANAEVSFSTTGFIAPVFTNDIGVNLGNNQNVLFATTQTIAGLKNYLNTDYFNMSSYLEYYNTNVTFKKKVSLRYLMIDKSFNFNDSDAGIRLGRIKHKFGFYGSLYNEPELSEFIYMPQAIYRDTFNKIATGGDGGEIYYDTDIGNNIVKLTAGIYRPIFGNTTKELVASHFFTRDSGKFNAGTSNIYNIGIYVSNTKTNTSYNLDIIDLDFGFIPSQTIAVPVWGKVPNPLLGTSRINTKIYMFGIRQYFKNDFDITAEYIMVNGNGDAWDRAASMYSSKPPHGYLLTVRKSCNNFTISAGTDGYIATENKQVPLQLGQNDWNRYTYTYFVSGKYNFNSNNSIKAQIIAGEGTNTLIQALNQQSNKYWKALAIQYVLSF